MKKSYSTAMRWLNYTRPTVTSKAWQLGDIIGNRKLRIPWSLTIPDALRATEIKFPLIIVRGSQIYLSWFIVSLIMGRATIL